MRPWEKIFLGGLALVYVPALMSMVQVWSRVDYYSHGFMVPVVSIWMASRQTRRLGRIPRIRDPRGLIAIVASLAMNAWGVLSGSAFVAGIGVVSGVAGATLYLCGSQWLRQLAFPVGFLAFMVPLPETWVTPVIAQLQLLASQVGVDLLQWGGMSLLRVGNVIQLPGGESVFVAEACSGITSIVTMLPLGVLLAYFTERTQFRRMVLVVSVIPLATLGNLLRIVGTLLACRYIGVDAATNGPLHDMSGIGTYVLGCMALLTVGALMRLLWPEPVSHRTRVKAAKVPPIRVDRTNVNRST
jgi:exosortase